MELKLAPNMVYALYNYAVNHPDDSESLSILELLLHHYPDGYPKSHDDLGVEFIKHWYKTENVWSDYLAIKIQGVISEVEGELRNITLSYRGGYDSFRWFKVFELFKMYSGVRYYTSFISTEESPQIFVHIERSDGVTIIKQVYVPEQIMQAITQFRQSKPNEDF